MSYGVKYRCQHKKDIEGITVTYQVEILQDGYAGAVTDVIGWGSNNVFDLQYENIDPKNLFDNPVQKGRLEFYLTVSPDLSYDGLSILSEIYGSDNDEYQMRLNIDGSPYWTGYILTDLLRYPETDYAYYGTIIAKDVTNLTGVDFTLSTTRAKIITTISTLLGYLGLGLDINTYTSWITSDTTDSSDFLDQIYHEETGFRDYAKTGDETDQPITAYKSLLRICQNYGLILRQEENTWKIYQFSALDDPTSVLEFGYNSSGVFQSSSTVDLTQSIDGTSRFVIAPSDNDTLPALKKVTGKFDHRTRVTTIQFPQEITLDSGNTSESFSQFFASDGTQTIELSGRIDAYWPTSQDGKSPTFYYRIQAGSYYWDDDGAEWTLSVTTNSQALTDRGRSSSLGVLSLGFLTMVTDVTPSGADGTLTVTLYISDSSDGDSDTTKVSNITFKINNQSASENSESIDYALTQSGVYSSILEYPDTYFGDGPIGYSLAALRYGSGDSELTSDSWQRRGTTISYRNLHEQLFKEVLDSQRGNTRLLDGTIIGNYKSKYVASYDSTYFFFLGGGLNGESEWRGYFIELNLTTGSDDFDDIPKFTDGTGSGSSSSGAGVSSGIDQGTADDRYFKINENLSEGDEATIKANLNLEIGTDVQAYDAELDTLSGLTNGEATAIVGVTETQWGYVGGLDQGLGTGNNVGFADISVDSIILKDSTGQVRSDTSDASDTKRIAVVGGGALSVNRGAYIMVHGNEYTTNPGTVWLVSGNVSGSAIEFRPKGTLKGTMDENGNLTFSEAFEVEGHTTLNTMEVGGLAEFNGAIDANSTSNFQGVVTLQSNIQTDDFALGTGSTGWLIDGAAGAGIVDNTVDGTKDLYVDNLTVRRSAKFFRLIVKNIDVLGGTEIMSVANGESATVSGAYDGTIVSNLGSTTVTGTGTAFTTDISASDVLYGLASGVITQIGTVLTVNSDTSITLSANALATTSGIYFVNSLRERVTFEDPSGGNITSFATNDLCVLQTFDINDPSNLVKNEWRTVSSKTANTVQFIATTGAPAPSDVIEAGDLVVQYGNTTNTARQSIIYRNVEGAPVVRVQVNINSFVDFVTNADETTAYAYANLNGLYGYSTDVYGFGAGLMSGDYMTADPTNGIRFIDGADSDKVLAQFSSQVFIFGDVTEAESFIKFDNSGSSLAFEIDTDTRKINNIGTTYPNALGTATSTASDLTFDGSSGTASPFEVTAGANKIIRWGFNFDSAFSGASNISFDVRIEGWNGSTWVDITGLDDYPELFAGFKYATNSFIVENDTPTFTVSDASDSFTIGINCTAGSAAAHTADVYFYMRTKNANVFTKYRMVFDDITPGDGIAYTFTVDSQSAIVYSPVFEDNINGSFIRFADTIYSTDDGLERRVIKDESLLA